MVIDNLEYFTDVFFRLEKFTELPSSVFLKLEGFNFAGSIKLKPAIFILNQLEKEEAIKPGIHHIIESSSGNFAIALAILCHSKGYSFTAVIDPNTTSEVVKLLKVYKANIVCVNTRDQSGGYLESRINEIKTLLSKNSNFVWANQYANQYNFLSHYEITAKEIHTEFNKENNNEPTYIFTGTSTTGTLNGLIRYFSEFCPNTKIIAVEPVGSVTFSQLTKSRLIPGIGASRPPELSKFFDKSKLHDIVWVEEIDTINMCNRLLDEYTLFLGGSTGSVLAAILNYKDNFTENDTIIAISPDFGHKYIDTVYNPVWVNDNYYL